MQPYQEAAEATRRSGELPLNAMKYMGGIALGTAGSMVTRNAISKIIPLLSPYVPESFAKKALYKIDPRFEKFIGKAEQEGFDFNEIKDFLGEKIKKTEESQEPAKQNRNIIEQYSPELHQYILEEIQNGRSPLEAGALATLGRKGMSNFAPIIDKITKDHKTPWSAIIETVYGQQTNPQKQSQQPQEPQSGKGQEALMAILNKINQRLG